MTEPNAFLKRLTELYWEARGTTIDNPERMKPVVLEISQLLKSWAPDEGQARICHLAIVETADKLARWAEGIDE